MDEAVAARALRWLSQEDYAAKHNQVKSKRLPGTTAWIEQSPQFQRWLIDGQQVLLCVGKPGVGKTILTSGVIDTLFEKHGTDANIGIAFYYFDFGRENQCTEQVLRSILFQLGRQLPSVPPALVKLHQCSSDNGSPPSIQDLLNAMSEMIGNMSRAYLVIDALDELSYADKRRLLPGLLGLREICQVSLFATSRIQPDVIQRFNQFPILDYEVTSDIKAYIVHRMASSRKFIREDPDLRDYIQASVIKKSEGVFLIAVLLMERVASALTVNQLKRLLPDLPESLQDLYKQKMDNIEQKPKEEKDLAKRVLSWLLLARRPLKRLELQIALAIEEGSSVLEEHNMPDETEIVTLCEGFVDVTKTWSLVHSSAGDYLENTLHRWYPEANAMIAKACLTYLAFDTFGSGYCKTDEEFESRLRDNPFFEYAAKKWPYHLDMVEILSRQAFIPFLLDQNKVSSASQAMRLYEMDSRQPEYSQDFDREQTGLHLAAYFGLESVVELLLSEMQDRTVKDARGRTPLWRATEANHEEIMRKLSRVDRKTFTLMLNSRQDALAYLLLQVAGQITRDSRSRTALHIGVIHQDMELIRHALKCGVDINARDADGYSAIQLAIQNQATSAIDLLLENSASTEDATTSNWLECYGRSSSDIMELSEDSLRRKKIVFLAANEFTQDELPTFHDMKRLRVFPETAVWPVIDRMDPPSNQRGKILCEKRNLVTAAPMDEVCLRYSIVASMPVSDTISNGGTFTYGFKDVRIGWTMTPFLDSSGKEQWVAVNYISTLPVGSIPDSGAALFTSLVNALLRAWLELCSCVDDHLIMCRPDVLAANGEQPKLIHRLLEDANTWNSLRHLLQEQIAGIRRFQEEYLQHVDGDEVVVSLANTTDNLAHEISMRIDKFDAVSTTLIQIEFNLTSIREAQKSTSINRSMKRLSWITFIFLPLIFVSGIFGMNVDILEANPSWGWYVVFMAGTLSLTMIVWIVFKRFPDLEDHLEHSFGWLIGPSKSKQATKDSETEKGLTSGSKKFV